MGMAAKIAKMPPVAVRLTKLSLNRILDNMGQANSFWQYYVTHQLAHQTAEFKDMIQSLGARPEGERSLKSFLADRDKKFAAE